MLKKRVDILLLLIVLLSGLLLPIGCQEEGTITWDGGTYTGELSNRTPHGKGSISYPDGRTYQGEFNKGIYHGQGTIILPDGTIYEGEWREGQPFGSGTVTQPDGQKHSGKWENGKFVSE